MRKKVLAVVTAAVLALGCFAAVSAKPAGAIEGDALGTIVEKAAKSEGHEVATWAAAKDAADKGILYIKDVKANAAQKKAVKAIKEGKVFTNGAKSRDYEFSNDDYSVAGIEWTDLEALDNLTHLYAQAGTEKVLRVFNITADDADTSNPVTVKIVDSDVKASKKYALRHFKDGVWDNTSGKVTGVVNGVVTAEITKASPFALVELTGSAAPAADNKDAAAKNATGTKTAPKTGEV